MLRDIAAATASKPARSLVETARMPSHTPKWPPVLCPRPARLVRRVRQAHLSVISRLARSSHACMLWRDETATLRPVEARRPASNRWGEMLSRRIHESQIRRRRAEPPTIRDWTLALQLSSRDCCAASQCVPMCRTVSPWTLQSDLTPSFGCHLHRRHASVKRHGLSRDTPWQHPATITSPRVLARR